MSILAKPVEPDGAIRMQPIGIAHSPVQSQRTGGFRETESRIDLAPKYASYLRGLQDYSHVVVLYWMHEQTTPKATTRPQGHPAAPEVGMFATR